MSNFYVRTEEQTAILETVRRFVEEHVTPVAADLDRAEKPEDGFSWDIVEAADKIGIITLSRAE